MKPVKFIVDFDAALFKLIATDDLYKNCRDAEAVELVDIPGLYAAAKKKVKPYIEDLLKATGFEWNETLLFLSIKAPYGYHRNLFYESYKANRNSSKVYSKVLGQVVQLLKGYILRDRKLSKRTIFVPGFEADDLMGVAIKTILPSFPHQKGITYSVHSIDKDIHTIPDVILYDGGERPYGTTQETAAHYLRYQTVVGDTADGFSGISGQGPAKWENNWDHLTQEEYEQKYINMAGQDHLDLMTNCARMLDGTPDDISRLKNEEKTKAKILDMYATLAVQLSQERGQKGGMKHDF